MTFEEVIKNLLDADMNNELDDKMKGDWAKQGFHEFNDYFKLCLPNAWQWRFYKRLMKGALLSGTFQ